MQIVGGAAYCVMFGAGPPGREQGAARERFRRTTLAYMGARSQQPAARELGIRFTAAHTRAIYSRLVTGSTQTLTVAEAQNAYEWGDWAALAPEFWIGGRRLPGTPERDMPFDPADMRSWPYRYLAAMASIYGWETLTETGLFLDADALEWWEPLRRLAAMARSAAAGNRAEFGHALAGFVRSDRHEALFARTVEAVALLQAAGRS